MYCITVVRYNIDKIKNKIINNTNAVYTFDFYIYRYSYIQFIYIKTENFEPITYPWYVPNFWSAGHSNVRNAIKRLSQALSANTTWSRTRRKKIFAAKYAGKLFLASIRVIFIDWLTHKSGSTSVTIVANYFCWSINWRTMWAFIPANGHTVVDCVR